MMSPAVGCLPELVEFWRTVGETKWKLAVTPQWEQWLHITVMVAWSCLFHTSGRLWGLFFFFKEQANPYSAI